MKIESKLQPIIKATTVEMLMLKSRPIATTSSEAASSKASEYIASPSFAQFVQHQDQLFARFS